MAQINSTYPPSSNFNQKETLCIQQFSRRGRYYHLWTPENFEIIFVCREDFKMGMGVVGICAKMFPDVIIITFELMSNHLHIVAAGSEMRIREMFAMIRRMLEKNAKVRGRTLAWNKFEPGLREIQTLEDLRNVIVYNNRNGFVVSPDHSPYTYQWGAGKFYFNPDACELAEKKSTQLTVHNIRATSHTKTCDQVKGLIGYDGYVVPLSFCDIKFGEAMFRDASHYFSKVSKNIESSKEIAKEIGESIFYTDDDLYSAVCGISLGKYNVKSPSLLPTDAKIETAKTMHYDYNASTKQIQRMLKLPFEIVTALGF